MTMGLGGGNWLTSFCLSTDSYYHEPGEYCVDKPGNTCCNFFCSSFPSVQDDETPCALTNNALAKQCSRKSRTATELYKRGRPFQPFFLNVLLYSPFFRHSPGYTLIPLARNARVKKKHCCSRAQPFPTLTLFGLRCILVPFTPRPEAPYPQFSRLKRIRRRLVTLKSDVSTTLSSALKPSPSFDATSNGFNASMSFSDHLEMVAPVLCQTAFEPATDNFESETIQSSKLSHLRFPVVTRVFGIVNYFCMAVLGFSFLFLFSFSLNLPKALSVGFPVVFFLAWFYQLYYCWACKAKGHKLLCQNFVNGCCFTNVCFCEKKKQEDNDRAVAIHSAARQLPSPKRKKKEADNKHNNDVIASLDSDACLVVTTSSVKVRQPLNPQIVASQSRASPAVAWKRSNVEELPCFSQVFRQIKTGTSKKQLSNQFLDHLYELWESSSASPLPAVAHWRHRPVFVRCVVSENEAIMRIAQALYCAFPLLCRAVWPPAFCTVVASTASVSGILQLPLAKSAGLRLFSSQEDSNVHAVHPFETDVFKGEFLLRINGLPGADAYFNGRKRLVQYVIQGQFKQRLRVDQVLGGQFYKKPWSSLPPKLLLKFITSFVAKLFPSFQADLTSDQPYYIFPLMPSIQVLNVVDPKYGVPPPPITSHNLQENTFLLGEPFSASDVYRDATFRRKFFSKPNTSNLYFFEPEYIYTMEFYQHLFDVKNYSVRLPFKNFQISSYLTHQPVEFATFVAGQHTSIPRLSAHVDPTTWAIKQKPDKHCSSFEPSFLWRIQLWHDTLLEDVQEH